MISLHSPELVQLVANGHRNAALRSLLSLRMGQLNLLDSINLSQATHLLIFEPGDHLRAMEAELGFTPLENIVDGSRFSNPDFTPSWEWIEAHEGWFELAYLFSDDGLGTIIYVQRADGVDPDLIALCNEWSGTANAA